MFDYVPYVFKRTKSIMNRKNDNAGTIVRNFQGMIEEKSIEILMKDFALSKQHSFTWLEPIVRRDKETIEKKRYKGPFLDPIAWKASLEGVFRKEGVDDPVCRLCYELRDDVGESAVVFKGFSGSGEQSKSLEIEMEFDRDLSFLLSKENKKEESSQKMEVFSTGMSIVFVMDALVEGGFLEKFVDELDVAKRGKIKTTKTAPDTQPK